jgi:hypothetical protein
VLNHKVLFVAASAMAGTVALALVFVGSDKAETWASAVAVLHDVLVVTGSGGTWLARS